MLTNQKVIVVLLAYNAIYTLQRFYLKIPLEIVDDLILVYEEEKL